MASSAPAAVVALTLAALAAAAAYGGGPVLLISAIPMLIIANAYRRLNMWNANAGASFEWVGRAINPYLGFLTGWLMIAGYVLGTLSGVEVLGPSVLAVFTNSADSTWPNVVIATAVGLVMIVIAVVGIRITARVQVVMAVVEYAILVGMSIWGLVYVLGHHPGTFPITSGWFSLSGIGGQGSIVGGFLIAVFAYSGWDGTIYVNEEVKQRRTNPGRAAIIAVALLAVIYTLAQVGLQGVVSPKNLQANSATALVYVAQALGGGGWAKVMALAIALSAIATTGAGIVVGARIIYGMARYRALPGFLANVNRRFATPAAASVVFGVAGRRARLGLPARHLGPERLQRRGRHHRPGVRPLLRPHRAGRHRLLPAPGLLRRPGRADARHPADRVGRVPGLDGGEVPVDRARRRRTGRWPASWSPAWS